MTLQTGQMITELIDQLKQHPDVAQWSILHEQKREWQHYIIQQKPEATREVMQEYYKVMLYHRHPHPSGTGTAMGAASITLTEADLPNLSTKIAEGLLAASLTNNEPWSLPKPAPFPNVPLADEETLKNPFGALETFTADLYQAVEQEPSVRLSAAEMFFEETVSRIYNHEGVNGEQHTTSFLIEVVLLAAAEEGEETEHWFIDKRRRIQDLNIRELIKENAQYARDSIVAELPQTWSGAVVIDHGELPEMFYPLNTRVSGQLKYMKLTSVVPGESFFGEHPVEGEPLQVSFSSALPYGVRSFRFSEEGVPGQAVDVVSDNVFRQYVTNQRYADYLGVTATGDAGNLVIAPGSTPQAELLQGPVYHIVKFSAMMPNPYTGDLAVEIKLGYFIDEQGHRTPIKGGSVSGNLFEILRHAKYAQEEVFAGSYQGPAAVRFERHLTISGQ